MLKRILFLLIILSCKNFSQTLVQSKVTNVIVYPQKAMVTREANIKLNKGRHQIVISNLTDNLLNESVRIISPDINNLDIVEMRVETKFTNDDRLERLERIQSKIDSVEYLIRVLKSKNGVLKNKENFVESLKSNSVELINKNMLSKVSSAKDWKEMLQFIEESMQEINTQKLDYEFAIEKYQKEISLYEKEKNEYKNNQKFSFKNIRIDVEAAKINSYALKVSYIVENASWHPLYDAKFKDESESSEITYMGMVQQTTGEDWKNIEVILSNSSPTLKKKIPQLRQWVIDNRDFSGAYKRQNKKSDIDRGMRLHYSDDFLLEPDKGSIRGYVLDLQTGEPLVGANVIVVGTNIGASTDINGKFVIKSIDTGKQKIKASYLGYQTATLSFDVFTKKVAEVIFELPEEEVSVGAVEIVASKPLANKNEEGDNKQLMQKSFSRIKSRDLFTQFILEKKYNIPSDFNSHRVVINEFALPTELSRISIPKIDESVFMKAKIMNNLDFPLLSGNVNIYMNNEYINSGELELTNPNDTLMLALGVDYGIKISRVLKNKNLDKSGLFSSTDKLEFSFEYSVTNLKNNSVHLKIVDQLPMTINKDIKITILEPALLYENLKSSKELEFDVEIKANDKQTIPFSFMIEYPDNIAIFGIDNY